MAPHAAARAKAYPAAEWPPIVPANETVESEGFFNRSVLRSVPTLCLFILFVRFFPFSAFQDVPEVGTKHWFGHVSTQGLEGVS